MDKVAVVTNRDGTSTRSHPEISVVCKSVDVAKQWIDQHLPPKTEWDGEWEHAEGSSHHYRMAVEMGAYDWSWHIQECDFCTVQDIQ